MTMISDDCAICGGSGWLVSSRDTKGKPRFKKCAYCRVDRRNRLFLLAFVGLLIAVVTLVSYLWIV